MLLCVANLVLFRSLLRPVSGVFPHHWLRLVFFPLIGYEQVPAALKYLGLLFEEVDLGLVLCGVEGSLFVLISLFWQGLFVELSAGVPPTSLSSFDLFAPLYLGFKTVYSLHLFFSTCHLREMSIVAFSGGKNSPLFS